MFSDYQNLVDMMVRDETGTITGVDRDKAIQMAVIRYSTDRPRDIVENVVGDGSGFLSYPPSWQGGISQLIKVGELEFDEVPTVDGNKIVVSRPVIDGEQVNVRFTTGHVLDEASDTIPLSDQEAIANYAAHILLNQLASAYTGTQKTTISSDSADHGSRNRDYAARAKDCRNLYLDHMGLNEKRTEAAGVVVDWDRGSSDGRDRLIHRRSRR